MPNILWAEDGLDDRYLINQALRLIARAPTVQFVADGEEALAALAKTRPDLLVLDVNMPWLDGVETLKRLRASDEGRDVPVVMFSTGHQEAAVAACRRLGILDYIQKPFHFADFTTAVTRICELAAAAPLAQVNERSRD